MSTIARGSIEPEVPADKPQVTVRTSALVDDLGVMSYAVYDESVSIFFGRGNDDSIDIGFTDQSLLNLARLVNRAVCAMLQARGIPIPPYIGMEQPGD